MTSAFYATITAAMTELALKILDTVLQVLQDDWPDVLNYGSQAIKNIIVEF